MWFNVTFNSQSHIATDSIRMEEPVHTSWSRFCTVNHRASASNYQLSNMKRPAGYSNRRPQRLEASTLTATPPSPLHFFRTPKLMVISDGSGRSFKYGQWSVLQLMKSLTLKIIQK